MITGEGEPVRFVGASPSRGLSRGEGEAPSTWKPTTLSAGEAACWASLFFIAAGLWALCSSGTANKRGTLPSSKDGANGGVGGGQSAAMHWSPACRRLSCGVRAMPPACAPPTPFHLPTTTPGSVGGRRSGAAAREPPADSFHPLSSPTAWQHPRPGPWSDEGAEHPHRPQRGSGA